MVILVIFLFLSSFCSQAQDLEALINKVDDLYTETSSVADIELHLQSSGDSQTFNWTRWTKGKYYSRIEITGPGAKTGLSYLRRQNSIWSRNPNKGKILKAPESFLNARWLGSHFLVSDIVRTDSLARNYDKVLLQHNNPSEYKILLTPRPFETSQWQKIIVYINKQLSLPVKIEFIKDTIFRTLIYSDIGSLSGKVLPQTVEIITNPKQKIRTFIKYKNIDFANQLGNKLFTRRYL